MIAHIPDFIRYFDSIRRRTGQFIGTVPADRLDWAPLPGEYTCGDLVRHLAAAEEMFVGAVVTGRWLYPGHTATGGAGLAELVERLDRGHVAAMERLGALPDSALGAPCPTLDGPPVKTWRLLMALVEHEVHHRSQLAMYLTLMGVPPPHIYGLGVEDVIARATG